MNRRILPMIAMGALASASLVPSTHARGMISAMRADTNPTEVLNQLQAAWTAFQSEHKTQMAALRQDVVATDKLERINATIAELQTSVNAHAAKMAALAVGAGGNPQETAEVRAYSAAFNTYFRRGVDAGLNELAVKAALSTDSNPDGGFVVSPQIEQTIERVLAKVSAIRNLARVISISTGVYKKPFNLGGALAGWVGEKQTRTQTQGPQLSELQFPVMECYAMPAATQALLDDARIDIAQWLADEVTIAIAEQEGPAFVTGDGVNKPQGILSYTNVADANYKWGNIGFIGTGGAGFAADPNGANALIDLVSALKPAYRTGASFLMNRSTEGAIRKLKDSNGRMLWEPSIALGKPATLLGYPVANDDTMPDLGANAYPIAFSDFQRSYVVVDRYGIRVLRDPFTSKPYILFYTTKRVGGGVQNFEAIKLLKCA